MGRGPGSRQADQVSGDGSLTTGWRRAREPILTLSLMSRLGPLMRSVRRTEMNRFN